MVRTTRAYETAADAHRQAGPADAVLYQDGRFLVCDREKFGLPSIPDSEVRAAREARLAAPGVVRHDEMVALLNARG